MFQSSFNKFTSDRVKNGSRDNGKHKEGIVRFENNMVLVGLISGRALWCLPHATHYSIAKSEKER